MHFAPLPTQSLIYSVDQTFAQLSQATTTSYTAQSFGYDFSEIDAALGYIGEDSQWDIDEQEMLEVEELL